jgi:peroxiredoxin
MRVNRSSPAALCISAVALLAVLCGYAASLADEPATAPRSIAPWSTTDLAGQAVSSDDWNDKRAVVLFFLGTECPVSNGYAPAMQRFVDKYADRVVFYGVHADPSVTAADATAHAREYGLKFPLVLDPQQQVAQRAGVKIMPEVVVARSDGTVVYRGRIDDRYAVGGKRRDQPTTHELADAIEAVLAGRQPAVNETKAFGCPLPKPKVAEPVGAKSAN